jgi:hypothetical protein
VTLSHDEPEEAATKSTKNTRRDATKHTKNTRRDATKSTKNTKRDATKSTKNTKKKLGRSIQEGAVASMWAEMSCVGTMSRAARWSSFLVNVVRVIACIEPRDLRVIPDVIDGDLRVLRGD